MQSRTRGTESATAANTPSCARDPGARFQQQGEQSFLGRPTTSGRVPSGSASLAEGQCSKARGAIQPGSCERQRVVKSRKNVVATSVSEWKMIRSPDRYVHSLTLVATTFFRPCPLAGACS